MARSPSCVNPDNSVLCNALYDAIIRLIAVVGATLFVLTPQPGQTYPSSDYGELGVTNPKLKTFGDNASLPAINKNSSRTKCEFTNMPPIFTYSLNVPSRVETSPYISFGHFNFSGIF